MALKDIADLAVDGDMQKRVAACAQQEGIQNPTTWAATSMLALAAQPGWASAWASAQAARANTIGNDPAVITDGMILSAVQALNTGGAA